MNRTYAHDPTLPHLQSFSIAAEHCSFTEAARVLRVSQAAISQRVQALERLLDTALFAREGGGVRLTESGKKLYDFAHQVLDLHRAARGAITGVRTQARGELVLAASSIPGEHLLPALLSGYCRQYPHVRTRAAVSDSIDVESQVDRGVAHLGLVGRKPDNPHLVSRFLARDRMVLVVPARHPLRKRKKLSIKDLARYPLVVRELGSGLRHAFERSLESAGSALADLKVALEFGSNEAIKAAVLRRVGVAILSIYAIKEELKSGRLHAIEIADLSCSRDMYVIHDHRRALPAAARLFLSFLEAHPIASE